MTTDLICIVLFLLLVLTLGAALGFYIGAAFKGRPTFIAPVVQSFEHLLYRICGVNEQPKMTSLHLY